MDGPMNEDDLKRKVEICRIKMCTNKQMLIQKHLFVLLSVIVLLTASFESTFKTHNEMHTLKDHILISCVRIKTL
jgi:hypothetical protein